jgi:hypothetical protein
MAKNVPTDEKLWTEIQSLAKGESSKPVSRGKESVNPVNDGKGFETFPSAYANGWALAQYKRLGGKWKKESKKAGLIRPPKHIVDKVSEILTAGFASYWVGKQKEMDNKPYLSISLEKISNFENLIEDLDEAYMSVRMKRATFDELERALRALRVSTQELIDMFKGRIPPTLEKMSHILENMSPISVFEEPKKYKKEFMFLGRTFGLISELRSLRQDPVSYISEKSRALYEGEANKVKRFDKFLDRPSQSTWIFQTEDLGTLRLQVRESKGAKGLAYYRYDEIDDLHTITVRVFPNSNDLSGEDLGKIKDYVRHELVHAMQKKMSLDFNVDQAGIPFQKRDMTYLQGHKYKEKDLKAQYEREGLDSDLVSIHALDDIEFYTRLLDEVVEFQRLNVSGSDLNQEVHEWVSKRKFFVSLKRFKKKNWNKAVGIFFEAVSSNRKYARKWDKDHCESKSCDEMGFSEKASCRPYKNCYEKSASSKVKPMYLGSESGAMAYDFYFMRVEKDYYYHYTYRDRAEEIIEDGYLRPNFYNDQPGGQGVFAISGSYGQEVTDLQVSGSRKKHMDRIVALKFKTKTEPKYGYPEEIIWDKPVKLIRPEIVSFSEAEADIKRNEDLGEYFKVFYDFKKAVEIKKEYGTVISRVAHRYLRNLKNET